MTSPILPPARSLAGTMKDHAFLLLGFVALMWAAEIADQLPYVHLDQYGIRPRTTQGLVGIFCAPFLHVGFHHLMANTVPFFILGAVVLLGGKQVFWSVTLFVVLLGGLGVWLFAGSGSVHVGASGLVFGYLGFLLARGFLERSWVWILVSCLTLLGYGSLLFGVLPGRTGVSWQSHLFGFLAGLGASRILYAPERKILR